MAQPYPFAPAFTTTTKTGVFPASGGIGGSAVKHLLRLLPAQDLVFIARDTSRLDFASKAGATVRQADYDDDNSLEHVFKDIHTLFLISYPSIEYGYRAKRHSETLKWALCCGVKYVFYGSLGFAGDENSKDTVAHVMLPHIDTEKSLQECTGWHPNFGYTVVREGLYSESYPIYTSFFDLNNPADEIKIPHDGGGPGIAWVKREELGEGTAELIARFVREGAPNAFEFRNRVVRLTGSQVLSLKDTVDILGKIAGKPGLRIREVSAQEYATQPQVPPNLTYRGIDYSMPWATAFEGIRQGEAAQVSLLLRELLGREPEDFETTIRAHRAHQT